MANDVFIHSYDWDSDISEMSSAAASGLLVSNHSYGTVAGWYWNGSSWSWVGDQTVSTTEDYVFGFYTDKAKYYDEVSYNAPYYLIVKSAGNDRGEGPTNANPPIDGGANGFDCIPGDGVAKNILTVGATTDLVNGPSGNPSEVTITSFSSFGPADDGRVKPDIVGNGYGLYSTSSQGKSIYYSSSGTIW